MRGKGSIQAEDIADRLRECERKKGEKVKNIFVDIIYEGFEETIVSKVEVGDFESGHWRRSSSDCSLYRCP